MSSVTMESLDTFLTFLCVLIKTIYYLILWLLNNIADVFKAQIKYISTKMRKDEANPRTTVCPNVVELFSTFTDWWKPDGPMKGLHTLNSYRIPFIIDCLVKNLNKDDKPLKGLKILDAGCGGGILSEELAKLGASVVGIDPTEKLIDIAEAHKLEDPDLEKNNPTYIITTVEEHISQYSNYYDAVVASEVIDHVGNPEFFIKSCIKALKPGGKIFFSAPNRTWVARFGLLFFAQYISKVVPKNSLQYEKFVTPKELSIILEKYNCRVDRVQGLFYNFLESTWLLIKPLHSHYALQATKIN